MTSRRTFLGQAGGFAAAALVPALAPAASPHKLGLQLYTLRGPLAGDVEGTLKRVAGLGYQEVETYGFDSERIGYYGLAAGAFAQLLRDNGLTAPSGHYDLNRFVSTSVGDLNRYVDRCIEGARALGQSYITWPLLDPDSRTIEKLFGVPSRNRMRLISSSACFISPSDSS